MKAKATHYAKVTVFLVMFATLIAVAGANAQTFAGRFTLPYQVHWDKAVLPAGDYTIHMPTVHSPALVRSANGKISAFVFTAIAGDREEGGPRLTIVNRGGERKVASFNLPQAGISLVYAPMTKAEHELLQAKRIEAVPLATAKE